MWVSWNSVSHLITSGNHAPGRATGGTNLLFGKMPHTLPYSHLVVTSVDTNSSTSLCLWLGPMITHTYVTSSPAKWHSQWPAGRQKRSQLHHQFLHNYHMKVSMHDGNLDGVMRIFVHHSWVLKHAHYTEQFPHTRRVDLTSRMAELVNHVRLVLKIIA